MIVCKFGGTSVQDADAIRRLGEIVRGRVGARPLVVVSALARVTDGLVRAARLARDGDQPLLEVALTELADRHRDVGRELRGAGDAVTAILADIGALTDQLLARLGTPLSARELDAILGQGEVWSSRLVAASLKAAGLRAEWVDARQLIVTDARHGRAVPDTAAIERRAQELLVPILDGGCVPVTQGYIGATADGVPTTLGRGGSDFTASLLGAALRAERVEIWTDVDGLMTADPRVVPSARVLPAATYDEAAELATFGAKVLHPATQMPLVRQRIPIVILNSHRPDRPGTLVTADPPAEADGSPVRSISWKRGVTLLTIRAPRMLGAYGFLRTLFGVFERHEVPVDVLASSEVSVSLTIEDRSHLDGLVRDLSTLGEVIVDRDRAIVAVVGTRLRHLSGVAARVFAAVPPANIEVISQGASEINMTFVVREDEAPGVVRRLHQEFFGTA